MLFPKSPNGKAQLIAMVHVHSNNALANTAYNKLYNTETFSLEEITQLDLIRKKLISLSENIIEETGNTIFKYCRNASFVLQKEEVAALENKISEFTFVQELQQRALKEVEIYQRNGINYIEIENVGAPYFMGNEIPMEDLLIIHVVAQAIRKKFPEINIGIQILSCGELEALPIAIACGAFFVRSEASVYMGLRPEGETTNKGNLAKFFYLRNYLNAQIGNRLAEERRLPAVWCDLQKKHTLFRDDLENLKTWLNTILFQKMEGVVLTGEETGSDISENDLATAQKALLEIKKKQNLLAGHDCELEIPLITGSGSNMEMYFKYADYIITGTSLKKNNYWENEVDEELVKKMIHRLNDLLN